MQQFSQAADHPAGFALTEHLGGGQQTLQTAFERQVFGDAQLELVLGRLLGEQLGHVLAQFVTCGHLALTDEGLDSARWHKKGHEAGRDLDLEFFGHEAGATGQVQGPV